MSSTQDLGWKYLMFGYILFLVFTSNVSGASLLRHSRYKDVDKSEFDCAGSHDQYKYYSHPTSCSMFYACADGKAYMSECVPGFLFHTGTTYCEREEIVACKNGRRPSTALPAQTTASVKTVIPVISSAATSNRRTTSIPTTKVTTVVSTTKTDIVSLTTRGTTTAKSASVDCTNQMLGTLLPDPTDCHSFYECTNVGAVQLSCAPGSLFEGVRCVTGRICP